MQMSGYFVHLGFVSFDYVHPKKAPNCIMMNLLNDWGSMKMEKNGKMEKSYLLCILMLSVSY